MARVTPALDRSPPTEATMEIGSMPRALALSPAAQFILASAATMLALALLDFIGAVFAKEWADTRQPAWFAAGLLTFAVLFVVYAGSLRTAELSLVTIGWVVFLQVGLVLYERFRYGATLSPAKWAAIALILALQAYLVLAPNERSQGVAESAPVRPIGGDVAERSPCAPPELGDALCPR
jgi:hypothetical protein